MKPPGVFRPWLRFAALTAAMAAVLLLASGVTLWHVDTPGSSATCPICHLAHMPTLRGMPAGGVFAPVAVAWVVPLEIRASYVAPISLDSPPRAPPL
jgi:hypothetical protein